MKKDEYAIDYLFSLKSGEEKLFHIVYDLKTLKLVSNYTNGPDWTKLEFHQCKCCTLTKDDNEYCPICINIFNIMEDFKEMNSFDQCCVKCITPERTISKNTDIQHGLSSMFGLIMAISDCPQMYLLKPMARFHLPFPTTEETIVRSSSFYLLRKYFEYKNGNKESFNLDDLHVHYSDIQLVNRGLLARINALTSKDSGSNAIIILNTFAQELQMECEVSLDSVEEKYF